VLSGVAAVFLAVAIAEPAAAAFAAVPAALVVFTRRPRIAALAATMLFAVLSALAIRRQLGMRFLADAAWPGRFEDLHRPGMVVVALLVAGCLAADRWRQAG
jgi:hypothetical protein